MFRVFSGHSFSRPIITLRILATAKCGTQNADDDASIKNIQRKFKLRRGTGDNGKSSLFSGERLWKDDKIFEALGSVDELSAAIGKMRYMCDEAGLFDVTVLLTEVQCTLQDLCSHIATPLSSKVSVAAHKLTRFDEGFVEEIDQWIDYYANDLPPLKEFILPGGNLLSSCMHEARCISRRAERSLISLIKGKQIDEFAFQYINRLSDLFFVLARYVAHYTKSEEISYRKRRPKESDYDKSLKHDWKSYKV